MRHARVNRGGAALPSLSPSTTADTQTKAQQTTTTTTTTTASVQQYNNSSRCVYTACKRCPEKTRWDCFRKVSYRGGRRGKKNADEVQLAVYTYDVGRVLSPLQKALERTERDIMCQMSSHRLVAEIEQIPCSPKKKQFQTPNPFFSLGGPNGSTERAHISLSLIHI